MSSQKRGKKNKLSNDVKSPKRKKRRTNVDKNDRHKCPMNDHKKTTYVNRQTLNEKKEITEVRPCGKCGISMKGERVFYACPYMEHIFHINCINPDNNDINGSIIIDDNKEDMIIDGSLPLSIFTDKSQATPFICSNSGNNLHVPKKVYSAQNGAILCQQCSWNYEGTTQNIAVENIVNKFSVNCVYKKYGCCWAGFVSLFDEHENKCLFKPILCEFCQKYTGTINSIKQHIKGCDKVIIKCELKCGQLIQRSKMKDHINMECTNYKQICSNNGCNKKIKRGFKYNDHINNTCEHRIVTCPFQIYGCNVNYISNKKLSNHLKTSIIDHYLMKINNDNDLILKKISKLSDDIIKIQSQFS